MEEKFIPTSEEEKNTYEDGQKSIEIIRNKKGKVISKNKPHDAEAFVETMPPMVRNIISGADDLKKEIEQGKKMMTKEEKEMSEKRKEIYEAGQDSVLNERK